MKSMIFAVHLSVKMAEKEERAKTILEKFVTDDTGIIAVHDFKESKQYITEKKASVRLQSKIPGYIFIEMDKDFVDNNNDVQHKEKIPAITWHFLKSKLMAFNINILDYNIPYEELQKYFDMETVIEETIMDVVISIDKETEELIEIAEEDTHSTHSLGNKFIDVFCVAVKKAESLISTKEGRTRLNISRCLWKMAYSLFDPLGSKKKEAFLHNHTYSPFLIKVIQGLV